MPTAISLYQIMTEIPAKSPERGMAADSMTKRTIMAAIAALPKKVVWGLNFFLTKKSMNIPRALIKSRPVMAQNSQGLISLKEKKETAVAPKSI
jgi:hypothetical protein